MAFCTMSDVELTMIVEAVLADPRCAAAPERVKHVACTVAKMDPDAFDKWLADHPDLMRLVVATHAKSRLQADGNLWKRAEVDAGLELKIRGRQEPEEWAERHEFKINGKPLDKLDDREIDLAIASIEGTQGAQEGKAPSPSDNPLG